MRYHLRTSALGIVALLIGASSLSFASDQEFKSLVHGIEMHYGVRHSHIPFLGLASFFARPYGVSDMKIAIFPDFHASAGTNNDDIRQIVAASLGPSWQPFIWQSRRDGETTLIYMNPSSAQMQMLLVSIETNEATVIQMKLDASAMKHWIDDPDQKVKERHGD